MQQLGKFALVALTAAAVGACDSSTGLDGDAQARVFLTADGVTTTSAQSSFTTDLLLQSGMGPIALDAVDSISITLTSVQALRVGADSLAQGGNGFVTLDLTGEGGARINLMQLAEAADSLLIAAGEIDAGTYTNVRLHYDAETAQITLNRDVTVGAQTFVAGVHELRIPSGEQTGIKVQLAGFTVGEGDIADVLLTFDTSTSVGNIILTGSGQAMMTPVLHARVTTTED
jgi:hypothetical protein